MKGMKNKLDGCTCSVELKCDARVEAAVYLVVIPYERVIQMGWHRVIVHCDHARTCSMYLHTICISGLS